MADKLKDVICLRVGWGGASLIDGFCSERMLLHSGPFVPGMDHSTMWPEFRVWVLWKLTRDAWSSGSLAARHQDNVHFPETQANAGSQSCGPLKVPSSGLLLVMQSLSVPNYSPCDWGSQLTQNNTGVSEDVVCSRSVEKGGMGVAVFCRSYHLPLCLTAEEAVVQSRVPDWG